jgi:hypothetical protein
MGADYRKSDEKALVEPSSRVHPSATGERILDESPDADI